MFHTSIDDVMLIHSELEDFGVPMERLMNDRIYWTNDIREEMESEISINLYMDMYINWYRAKRLNIQTPIFDKQKIYLIISDEYYKIGKSTNPHRRLQEINTHTPLGADLYTDFQADNVNKCESFLHSLFNQSRKNGEWFCLFDCEVDALNTISYAEKGRFYPKYPFTSLMRFIDDIEYLLTYREVELDIVSVLEI